MSSERSLWERNIVEVALLNEKSLKATRLKIRFLWRAGKVGKTFSVISLDLIFDYGESVLASNIIGVPSVVG